MTVIPVQKIFPQFRGLVGTACIADNGPIGCGIRRGVRQGRPGDKGYAAQRDGRKRNDNGTDAKVFPEGHGNRRAALAGTGALSGCQASADGAGASGDGTGSGTAANASEPSFLTAPDPIAESDISKTIDTEVLVIGAGIAGAATASSCVENGVEVCMVEKNEFPRAIGLDYGLVNPSIMADVGIEAVDVNDATADHLEKSCHLCRDDKVYRFMSRSGEAGDWWIEKAKGYGFEPQVIAMKSESEHYKNYVHPVELWHAGVNLADEGDWYAPMAEMLANVQQEVSDAGGTFMNNTEAVQLLTADDGKVTGAVCSTKDGYIQINASKGVVLACGDFGANEEMLHYYSTIEFDKLDEDSYFSESSGLGEGQQMGLWAGAVMQEKPAPLMLFHEYCYSYLRVNKLGQRYVNEDAGYTGTVNAQLQQPGAASWAVWDDKWADELPKQLPYAGGMAWDQDGRLVGQEWTAENEHAVALDWEAEDGLLLQADTLDDLANQMGFEGQAKETFLATVERYNQLVDDGDTDFGKRPELMCKIEKAPFYALKMRVELGVSVAGLVTNAESECLNADGAVIEGLYAVGNNAGGMFGADYNEVTVPGISLGRSVTFGYLLGKRLAQ